MSDEKKALREQDSQRLYDFKNEETEGEYFREKEGLTKETVLRVSDEKRDPQWMRDFRLKCLKIYEETPMVDWGPDIAGLDMDRISSYVRHKEDMKNDWNEVPEDIKNTFERLGIPQAERESLAGVGAQFDSELVYHNVRREVEAQGVIYTDVESTIRGELDAE